MESSGKVRVVLICHFSNSQISQHLVQQNNWLIRITDKLRGKKCDRLFVCDFAQWITNAIKEYEKRTQEIELHVISPYPKLKSDIQEFEENGIYYHFFHNEMDDLSYRLETKRQGCDYHGNFRKNRKRISTILNRIHPDLIHIVGAENPFYALSIHDVDRNIPTLVQLQTLMSDPSFETNYYGGKQYYAYCSQQERSILSRADYIGTVARRFIDIIKQTKPETLFVRAKLAVGEPLNRSLCNKQYDFVYFAANIAKACDLAIEAFAIAYKRFPVLKLLVVGGYTDSLKSQLDSRIAALGIQQNITFTGKLPTHDAVLAKIKEARFALLPIKIDLITGTIREAMASGLPVCTTITPATPALNENRPSVLLSETGDHQSLASNMIRLCEDPALAEQLRSNGFITVDERYGNAAAVSATVEVYHAILNHFHHGVRIPEHLIS